MKHATAHLKDGLRTANLQRPELLGISAPFENRTPSARALSRKRSRRPLFSMRRRTVLSASVPSAGISRKMREKSSHAERQDSHSLTWPANSLCSSQESWPAADSAHNSSNLSCCSCFNIDDPPPNNFSRLFFFRFSAAPGQKQSKVAQPAIIVM